MKKKALVLKFKDSNKEYMFEDKLFVIEDKALVENLEKPSIKNSESKLLIKSLGDIHVSDVVQIKVNMNETGFFLMSFMKDSLDEEKRKSLLEEIGGLKSNAVQTNSTQLKKAKKLISILNKYKPIYAVFVANGEFKVDVTKLSFEEYKFPLLVLKKPNKKFMIQPKQKKAPKTKEKTVEKPEQIKKTKPINEEKPLKKEKPTKKQKAEVNYSPFPLFDADYLFVFLFALLGSFGVITAIFEFMNGENIAIFLTILAVAFAFVLVLSVQSTLYKKGKLINPALRFYLIPFIVLGVAGGMVGGYFISKLVFKTEIENFDYKYLIILSIAISAPVMLSSVVTCILANLVVKRKYEKK